MSANTGAMGKHRTLVIGESGGTKTDWRIISGKDIIECFQTGSYHPARWNTDFLESERRFWEEKKLPSGCELWFFGSGCLPAEVRAEGKDLFKQIGFRKIQVFSDLDAAGMALFGEQEGLVCILGTGSVCAHWDGQHVTAIRGGKGFLLDDPGSGYYFGKRLLQEYLDGNLSEALNAELVQQIGSTGAVKKRLYSEKDLALPGRLAAIFPYGSFVESDRLHHENLRFFLREHNQWLEEAQRIGFVGTYGFYLQDILRAELSGYSEEPVTFLRQPADALTDYLLKHTF